MKIPVVDREDNLLGYKDRETELTREDIYRVSYLWLTDTAGRILLARRAYTKSHHPGMWGPAVAGTVEEGETYESNIIKETEEELGLKGIVPIPEQKMFREGEWKYFAQRFSYVVPEGFNNFVIPEKEVAEVGWFTKDELRNAINNNPDEFLRAVKEEFL